MTTANAIFLFGLMFMSVALMIAGYLFRRPAIAITASISWLVFGVFNRTLSTATWDIYYIMFMIGLFLLFVCFIEGIILRPKIEDTEPEEDIYDRELEEYVDRRNKWRERFGRVMGQRKPKNTGFRMPKIDERDYE